jgi:PAS domain-containing protein
MVQLAEPAKRKATAAAPNAARAAFARLANLSIRIRASAASAVLLICLLAVGASAYLTSTRSASGLRTLSQDLVAKRQAFADVSDAVIATHMKIFRYVSWASNGVSPKLLRPLLAEINNDLATLSNRIGELALRADLSGQERADLQQLLSKWQDCKGKARDTIEVGQTDAAIATMMLGETDDSFKAVDADLKRMSLVVTAAGNQLSNNLYQSAQQNKLIIIVGTLAGFVVSVLIAIVVGGSIVRPIRSITAVMRRLSEGATDVEIGHRERRDEIGTMAEAIDVFQRNIIEKHAMEQALTGELRGREATLRAIFDNMPQGVALFDRDLKMVAWNEQFRQFVDLPDEFLPGQNNFADFIRFLAKKGYYGLVDIETAVRERVARFGERYVGERVKPDGASLEILRNPIPGGGCINMYTDVTERKKSQALV